jgi:FKBP-type peptidyl-prolyl cis-trans isomerase SlyD
MGKKWLVFCLCSLILATLSQSAVGAEKEGEKSPLTISEGRTVSIEYTVALEDKKIVDTNVGGKPLVFIQGSQQIIPGVEKAILGMKVGESKSFTVSPEEAYGPVVKKGIVEVDRKKVPEKAWKVGAVVQGTGVQGQIVRGRVVEIKGDTATIDFNHPLAGKTLHFDVKILDIK